MPTRTLHTLRLPLFAPEETTLDGQQITPWQVLEAAGEANEAWIEEVSKPSCYLVHSLRAVSSHDRGYAGSSM